MRTKLRNVVELHHRDVRCQVSSQPQNASQLYAKVVIFFEDQRWLFDFTETHVMKILSDLARRGEILASGDPPVYFC